MEDQKRGMATSAPKIPPVKKNPHNINALTIMVMGQVGKIRSFRISRRIIFWAFLFFLTFTVVSIFVINDYLEMLRQRTILTEKINGLEKEVSNAKKNLFSYEQHIALQEEYIFKLEDRREQAPKPDEPVKTGQLQGKTPALNMDTSYEKQAGEKIIPEKVDVKDMVINKQDLRVNISFKLVNIKQEEGPASGYIHVIAANKESDPPMEWTYPMERLQNGFPVDFARGLLFFIQRFKQIRSKINLTTNAEAPSSVKVLIYDKAGKLILEKDFEVKNEP